ncbi:MAG: hypothetical protein RR911_02155 [Oscillospiraceae bacterium]
MGMLTLKISLILLGALLLFLGGFLLYKQKRIVINVASDDKEQGMFDNDYVRRIGIIEAFCGIVNMILGTLSFFLSDIFGLVASVIGVFVIVVPLLVNQIILSHKK